MRLSLGMHLLCNHMDAGRREGVILVSQTPPNVLEKPGHATMRRAAAEKRNGESRRAELADFLKAPRAALQPADVGLPGCGRRHTPGLRREEVAQLAGVGTTWYTWLEQGRDVRPSLSVLEALSVALRMTSAQRAHL